VKLTNLTICATGVIAGNLMQREMLASK